MATTVLISICSLQWMLVVGEDTRKLFKNWSRLDISKFMFSNK